MQSRLDNKQTELNATLAVSTPTDKNNIDSLTSERDNMRWKLTKSQNNVNNIRDMRDKAQKSAIDKQNKLDEVEGELNDVNVILFKMSDMGDKNRQLQNEIDVKTRGIV